MILSSIVKIVLALFLVLIGAGALGVAIGFTLFPILTSILLAGVIIMIFKQMHDVKTELDINKTFKVLLIAGGASWIPYVIHNAGSYLGPLAVFGSNGASQAGV